MEEGSSLHGSNSKSELESVSASSSSLQHLRKLLHRARHDVENMPGAQLWRREKVVEAMMRGKKSMSCKELKESIHCLQRHVSCRVAWLELVKTDPLSLTTGWDLSRFWRFQCAVSWFGFREYYPLEREEKFRTKGFVVPLWKYMTHVWRKEDGDVTLDEVSHNLHVYCQLQENKRIKLLAAAAAAARKKRRRYLPLRVEVLEKQARSHHGSGILPKKKKKKPNSANDGDDHDNAILKDDDPVSPHLSKLKPDHIPVRISKLKPS